MLSVQTLSNFSHINSTLKDFPFKVSLLKFLQLLPSKNLVREMAFEDYIQYTFLVSSDSLSSVSLILSCLPMQCPVNLNRYLENYFILISLIIIVVDLF